MIVSIALIATALTAVLRLQSQSLDLQYESRFVTVGRYLAQDRVAEIASRSELFERTDSGDFGDLFQGYQFQEEVTRVPDLEGLFKVEVTVFREYMGHTRNMQVRTYLFRPES